MLNTDKTNEEMKKIGEPLSLKISDTTDRERGRKLAECIDRRKASLPDVMRALIDAYLATDGQITFPVKLVPMPAERCSDGSSDPISQENKTVRRRVLRN